MNKIITICFLIAFVSSCSKNTATNKVVLKSEALTNYHLCDGMMVKLDHERRPYYTVSYIVDIYISDISQNDLLKLKGSKSQIYVDIINLISENTDVTKPKLIEQKTTKEYQGFVKQFLEKLKSRDEVKIKPENLKVMIKKYR